MMLSKYFSLKFLGTCILFIVLTSFSKSDLKNPKISIIDQEPEELVTDGLYFAEFYDYIYRGHFENLTIKRMDVEFLMIFEQYLRRFGRQCPKFLPTNKVEITELVCTVENVTTNGLGVETSRYCVEWEWIGTGIYAKPDLYYAKKEVEKLHQQDGLQAAFKMIADPNALGNSVDVIHKANGLKNDMAQIFNLNACNGSAIERFESNLRLFALGKPSIRMTKQSKYAKMKTSGGPTGLHNYNKLINDLVSDQSKTWSFNRYISGSISNLTIHSKDSQGRPKDLKANYNYKGFGNSAKGWVRVTFKNGLPDCMYFFDFPNNCKTPNSSILASYAKGDYAL
ncbi:hypothetical protein [uncultured Psychroserpens sp.]|uniref:hypothetical protein n=1 Tax=uncultured Psychroserpens sp. TaxID=255436 RepID=UPI002637B9AC|nr:hypothetical protein [uncultured Psychroserpens sp.]